MSKHSKKYSLATIEEAENLLERIQYKVTKKKTEEGLYIAIQYLHPLLDKSILKEGTYLVFSKELGKIEIIVFHVKEQDTLSYLFNKGWIKQCPPFSGKENSKLITLKHIFKTPDGFLRDYMKVTNAGEDYTNKPAEHMVIVKMNWKKTEEMKSTIVASWNDLDLHSDGAIWYKKKFTGEKIDRSRKTYQGQFLFLKYLMKTQSQQKKERLLTESEIKQDTKLYQNLSDIQNKLNVKLKKTDYAIKKSGTGFMLIKRVK
jgi:hypothetical protein